MKLRVSLFFAAIFLTWSCFVQASAQSTGSSFGGSSSGSASSSSGGGSPTGGWTGSSSYEHTAAPGYEPSGPVQLVIIVGFLGLLYGLFRLYGRLYSAPDRLDVALVQVVVDARARRFLQGRLETLARGRDGIGPQLATVSNALSASRPAWIYLHTQSFDPMPKESARAEMSRLSNDVRAGFRTELLRVVDGKASTEEAPALTPQEHEGEGVVLISVIVASTRTLTNAPPTLESVAALLAELAALGPALAALEVVWTPSTDADRMSTAELEAKYPALTRLTNATGRVFCDHCGGPHAAELARCPHCGAPRS